MSSVSGSCLPLRPTAAYCNFAWSAGEGGGGWGWVGDCVYEDGYWIVDHCSVFVVTDVSTYELVCVCVCVCVCVEWRCIENGSVGDIVYGSTSDCTPSPPPRPSVCLSVSVCLSLWSGGGIEDGSVGNSVYMKTSDCGLVCVLG